MAYTKQTWADLPTKTSPFTAARMNHIEDGISDNDTSKLDKSSVKTSKTTSATDVYSCTYINGIVESGNNSNGSWVKFIDGTMIEYGTNYGVNDSYRLITFPIEFISVPNVVASMKDYLTNYIFIANPYDITYSNCKITMLYLTISTGKWGIGANYFNWLAIGKWK